MKGNPFESQLERLARTLTEQFGVRVTCQGDNAWTDGNDFPWALQVCVLNNVPAEGCKMIGETFEHHVGPQA